MIDAPARHLHRATGARDEHGHARHAAHVQQTLVLLADDHRDVADVHAVLGGIVDRIDVVPSGRSAPSATGAVLGGIVGAVAGRQISDRTGGSEGNKNVATVAGAVAGAAAGNAIQNRTTGDTYNITVRMDDGRRVTINQHDLGGVRENTYVRIQNGRVVIR